MQPILLDRYRDIILRYGSDAARSPETLIEYRETDSLFYVPFEHVNRNARLVLVGITPGPNQIEEAYAAAQGALQASASTEMALVQAKRVGAFGGPRMRPNLVRMLDALAIPALLGIAKSASLWDADFELLHATSVVPHAAFRDGKPFAGSFEDVLASVVLRRSFEQDFMQSLKSLPSTALYIALGPTPLAALEWCAERGRLSSDQILGALAHPSSSSGTQVKVYLGEVASADLNPRDPVRWRMPWLLAASGRLRSAVAARLGGAPPPTPSPLPAVRRAHTPVPTSKSRRSGGGPASAPDRRRSFDAAGYICEDDHRVKVARFRSPRLAREVYLLKEGASIRIVVHPDQRAAADRAADASGCGPVAPFQHANLGTFPKRVNTADPIHHGVKVDCPSLGALERFLNTFDKS